MRDENRLQVIASQFGVWHEPNVFGACFLGGPASAESVSEFLAQRPLSKWKDTVIVRGGAGHQRLGRYHDEVS